VAAAPQDEVFLRVIIDLPHAEERPKDASQSTQHRGAGNSFTNSQWVRRRIARSRPSRVSGNIRSSRIRRIIPMLAVPVQYLSGTGLSYTAFG
jgi:hypothetical protein